MYSNVIRRYKYGMNAIKVCSIFVDYEWKKWQSHKLKHFTEKNSFIKMFRWAIFVLVCHILFSGLTFGAPMAQLQLPQLPQFINYIGNSPLPGGTPTSIFSANFTPGTPITGSGISAFSGDTGTAGGFDMIGNSISQAGIGVGNSVGNLFSGCSFQTIYTFFKT